MNVIEGDYVLQAEARKSRNKMETDENKLDSFCSEKGWTWTKSPRGAIISTKSTKLNDIVGCYITLVLVCVWRSHKESQVLVWIRKLESWSIWIGI